MPRVDVARATAAAGAVARPAASAAPKPASAASASPSVAWNSLAPAARAVPPAALSGRPAADQSSALHVAGGIDLGMAGGRRECAATGIVTEILESRVRGGDDRPIRWVRNVAVDGEAAAVAAIVASARLAGVIAAVRSAWVACTCLAPAAAAQRIVVAGSCAAIAAELAAAVAAMRGRHLARGLSRGVPRPRLTARPARHEDHAALRVQHGRRAASAPAHPLHAHTGRLCAQGYH